MRIERPVVVIGDPRSLRVHLFREALSGVSQSPLRVIDYADLLAGRCGLDDVEPHSIVRFESPGRDFDVEKMLLMRGASEAESEGAPAIAASVAAGLEYDRGRIWFPRQWYLGFRSALRTWHAELQRSGGHFLTAWPPDIETMFDKRLCHACCRDGSIPVPLALEPISCYDDLTARMQQQRWERVFVKLAHGSSASGALALQRHRGRVMAFTTVELVTDNGGARLYNSRPVRTTSDEDEIRRLVNALAPHRVHVEQWLPKAASHRGVFDLRVVVIAGQPQHVVIREGTSPITNLQLGNRRGSLAELLERLPGDRWHSLQATCSQVARLFPKSLQLGVDVLLTPDLRAHFVLEANAFGDLLPRALHDGQSTYEAELAAMSTLAGARP